MGKRSAIETTVGIFGAFLRKRLWRQAELARELEIQPRALSQHLNELQRNGFPLESERDTPHVYWRMSKDWFPGGLLLEAQDAGLLLRLLCRMPDSKPRSALLRRISSALPRQANPVEHLESVLQGVGNEAPFVPLVTDAAVHATALHFRYFSASRGALEWRHASIQRVLPGPPPRMVAHCHRSNTLKWFRIDGIVEARPDLAIAYRSISASDVDAYIATSLDGFAADETPIEHRFFVADPDARWVQRNLLPSMTSEAVSGGIRITCRTTATLRLARFVLGLAPVARAESPELAGVVAELATGMLARDERAKRIPRPDDGPGRAVASVATPGANGNARGRR